MEIRGLIFDCDGTLADTMPLHYEAWVDTLRPLRLALAEDRFYALGGRPTLEVAKLVVGEAGLTLDLEKLAAEKESRFLTRLDEVRPIEPIVDIARRHRGRLPMAVATGATRAVCSRILTTLGIGDWFAGLAASDDVTRHKPDPDIFLEAARQIGVEPAACRVYEDADLGIEAAKRAGMHWVDVRSLHQPRRVTPRQVPAAGG